MSEFKVLTDAEHIIEKIGMYAGSATTEPIQGMFFGKHTELNVIPALLKMIGEILDNSIDEAIRTNFKFANKIDITMIPLDADVFSIGEQCEIINEQWKITIRDNGRGIPIDPVVGSKYPRPVVAWTQARAGSNFNNDRQTIGTNGIGSFLTNVLSNEFVGKTADGKQEVVMVCNGRGNIKSVSTSKSTKQYTEVSFIPNLDIYGVNTITKDHIDFIRDRLDNLAVSFPNIAFSFNGVQIKIKNIKEYASRYCGENFVIGKDDKDNVIIFGPSGTREEFQLHSYINGLWLRNGGTHINWIVDQVITTLREYIRKKHKIDVLPNQIKQHLTIVTVFRGFVNMRFDSQSKERLTNPVGEISNQLSFDFDKISKQILNTPEIIEPMIQSILYKKELEDRRELAKKQKAVSKQRIVNHIVATDPNPENRMLLICEGLSAINSLLKVRNHKTTGGLPIRGKPLNVRGMRPVEIMKNKEISEIMAVIGLEFGKPASNLNYGKIAIFSDADVDGSHIYCLLLNLFSLWPDLFAQKRIYRLVPPLYYCTKGKQEKIFYTQLEFDSFNSDGWVVNRYKGLGSMSDDIYEKCVNNPKLECVVDCDENVMDMLFGKCSSGRKEWLLN